MLAKVDLAMDHSGELATSDLIMIHQRKSKFADEYRDRMRSSEFLRYLERNAKFPFTEREIRASIRRHGLFTEEMFSRKFNSEIKQVLDPTAVDPVEWNRLFTAALCGPGRSVDDSPAHMSRIQWLSFRVLYERLLDEIVATRSCRKDMREWFATQASNRECSFCGATFHLTWVLPHYYIASHFHTDCCFQCRILENPLRPRLDRRIREFVEACGTIPPNGTDPGFLPMTSQLNHDSWTDFVRAYAAMGGQYHVTAMFDSWFRALAQSGALPDGVQVTPRGIRCLAKDGHICHSVNEKRIDDWLTTNGLKHEREPLYPKHPTLNPGSLRADWLVGEVFVEYFGLAGDDAYDAKVSQKIELAAVTGVPLIALYPADMHRLESKLGQLLAKGSVA